MNGECEAITPGGPEQIKKSYSEKLAERRGRVERELEEVKSAQQLIVDNPEVVEVLDALAKVQRYL